MPAPIPRKPLFKKRHEKPRHDSEADGGEEALQLFSRSKDVFSKVVAEQEQRRQERQDRQEKLERVRLRQVKLKVEEESHSKRRRVSDERAQSSPDERGDSRSEREERRRDQSNQDKQRGLRPHREEPCKRRGSESDSDEAVERLLRQHSHSNVLPSTKESNTSACSSPNRKMILSPLPDIKPKIVQSTVISLDDSDSDNEGDQHDSAIQLDKKKEKSRSPHPIVSSREKMDFAGRTKAASTAREFEEVEEFPELVAKARENAAAANRHRLLDRLKAGPRTPDTDNQRDSAIAGSTSSHTLDVPPADPIIQILISSRIDDTRPIIVRRKLSQRLRDVRVAWCDKQIINEQPLNAQQKSSIFLTWRGNRLFDSSTGRVLNLNIGKDGTIFSTGDGFEEGRVHLEAWTEQAFKDHKKRIEEQRKKASHGALHEEEELPAVAEPQVPRIKLILKARDFGETSMAVRETSLVSRVISIFRDRQGVPVDKTISLRVDGDELDPGTTIAEADLEDGMMVDVHVS